jgi:hypothetical protein
MRIVFAFIILALVYGPTSAQDTGKLTNTQIASIIVQASRDAYYQTGHPCACPDDLARNGSRCGGRSAYSRPGGASPKCYPDKDVTAADIAAYRAGHSR